eukprot:CAMPEP_0119335732 /NCGR_PEP_ID=MMETSP1333-20130426/90184_1 /TAXON_ID=418940 /ORGANISM="Scyphosphaera apsteinii, Strain RCC1455" /LENGTH=111 /DNA_ID=CAMNT_0007346359 /DNA_START=25 /DNA_END=360 /DNA_ORIENTATION=-
MNQEFMEFSTGIFCRCLVDLNFVRLLATRFCELTFRQARGRWGRREFTGNGAGQGSTESKGLTVETCQPDVLRSSLRNNVLIPLRGATRETYSLDRLSVYTSAAISCTTHE